MLSRISFTFACAKDSSILDLFGFDGSSGLMEFSTGCDWVILRVDSFCLLRSRSSVINFVTPTSLILSYSFKLAYFHIVQVIHVQANTNQTMKNDFIQFGEYFVLCCLLLGLLPCCCLLSINFNADDIYGIV